MIEDEDDVRNIFPYKYIYMITRPFHLRLHSGLSLALSRHAVD